MWAFNESNQHPMSTLNTFLCAALFHCPSWLIELWFIFKFYFHLVELVETFYNKPSFLHLYKYFLKIIVYSICHHGGEGGMTKYTWSAPIEQMLEVNFTFPSCCAAQPVLQRKFILAQIQCVTEKYAFFCYESFPVAQWVWPDKGILWCVEIELSPTLW